MSSPASPVPGETVVATTSRAPPQFPEKFRLSKPKCPSIVWAPMKVRVVVMPKQSVLDPQGVAVRNALKDVGLQTVESVRVGKVLELEFTTAPDEQRLDEICRDLLSNPVIEDYAIRYPGVLSPK
ncbi:MAG TPA: phosphoribosylformylglycinamidine synthase subunit PurS [Chthoniobacterales bacterium]|jgi:phosphoribosylformylglycinamidine synthase subunit PurS